jgi:aryl-alcohol dehydrogenase-like predicted oxidoreductase
VRWAGLSNHTVELVERAHRVAPVTSCQEQLSLLAAPDDPRVLDFARDQGIGVLCWAPLASGFLTDGFSLDALDPDDFRRRSRLAERVEEIERLREEAAGQGRTLRRHAVAWVLEQPGVTAAIVGPRTEAEGSELAALAAD